MTERLRIRDACTDDLDDIVALLREDVIREVDESAVPVSAYRQAFDEISADPNHQLLVGEAGGQVVATAQLTWARRLTYVGGLFCIVESVRVRSGQRGNGFGGQLMEHVLELARERGAARVELTTNAQRVRAQEFYTRLGFVASHIGMKYFLEGES